MQIGKARLEIRTIPDGEYKGDWYGARCYIKDKTGCIIADFDTIPQQKGQRRKVKVIVKRPKIEIHSL